MKKLIYSIAVLLCIALLVGCSASSYNKPNANEKENSSWEIKEKSFDTPEKSIQHFVKKIAENNFAEALQACALSSYAEGFDFTAQSLRLKSIQPMTNAPSEYEFYRQINYATQVHEIGFKTKIMMYSLLLSDEYEEILNLTPYVINSTDEKKEGEMLDELIQQLNPKRLGNLKILSIMPPRVDLMNSELGIANSKKQAKVVGADEFTERVVLYDLDGVNYIGGFRLYKYDSDWKIDSLNSNYANTEESEALLKIEDKNFSEKEFKKMFE